MKSIRLTTATLALIATMVAGPISYGQSQRPSRSHSTQTTSRSNGSSRSSSSTSAVRHSDNKKQTSQSARPSATTRPQAPGATPAKSSTAQQGRRPSPAQRGDVRPSNGQHSQPANHDAPSAGKAPNRPENHGQPQFSGQHNQHGQPGQNRPAGAPNGGDNGFHRPGGPAPDGGKPGKGYKPGHVGPGGAPHHVAPHDRGPISHKSPARFYNHGCHYYGYRINRIPRQHHVEMFWGRRYYVCDGIYYSLYDGNYYVCRPPYGYLFSTDVYAYSPVLCTFAFYNLWDRQYNIINENYNVIAKQNQQIAQNNATLASQNEALQQTSAQNVQRSTESYSLATRLGLVQSYAAIGKDYYYDDGVFFITNSDGKYETIVPPAGAVIEELPDDYTTVTLSDDKEYYLVDDTVYRLILNEGKPYFEVLGQIQK